MALTVEPDVLTAGQTATITISGSSRAGEIVRVEINNDEGDTSYCEITLDADGEGSSTWNVPDNWTEAYFNYSTCLEVFRAIQSSNAPAPSQT